MIKHTKEEISLCKQVAERHRKKIGKGDWYVSEDSDYRTGWSSPMLNTSDYEPVKKKLPGIFDDKDRNDVSLWTISDCLEFLRERAYLVFIGQEENKGWCEVNTKKIIHRHGGKTPLEACLLAVLAVLEEGK